MFLKPKKILPSALRGSGGGGRVPGEWGPEPRGQVSSPLAAPASPTHTHQLSPLTHTLPDTHPLTRMAPCHSHTYTHRLSHSHYSCAHTQSQCLYTHVPAAFTLSSTHPQSLTHILHTRLSHPHTRVHAHTHPLAVIHAHTLCLPFTRSHVLTGTPTHSLSHTLAHTHARRWLTGREGREPAPGLAKPFVPPPPAALSSTSSFSRLWLWKTPNIPRRENRPVISSWA